MIKKQFPELYYFAPSIIVGKEGQYYYAMKYKDKYPFIKSSDASRVIGEIVNKLERGVVFLEKGDYVIDGKDLVLQKKGSNLVFIGETDPKGREWNPSGTTHIIMRNNGRLLDDGENWGYLKLKRIMITAEGEYSVVPLYFPKTVVDLEDCILRDYVIHKTNSDQFIRGGSGGPPAKPCRWNDVMIVDGRRGGTLGYHTMIYLWYEGFVWDGCSILIDQSESVEAPRFMHVVANTYAEIRNIDVYIANMVNKYNCFYWLDVDARLVNVQFPKYPDHVDRMIVTANYPKSIYLDNIRIAEAGPLTLVTVAGWSGGAPRIRYGETYARSGLGTVNGDGSTTDFALATHDLRPEVTDPSKFLVNVNPVSSDAIAGSPCSGYLSDENSDGVYETIRVKFTNAPPPGTGNVKVAWEVRYFGTL